MQTLYNYPQDNEKYCIALGNFDGVHIGHREIISKAVEYSRKTSTKSIVYTFATHSSVFLGNPKKCLTDNPKKADLIEKIGADAVLFDDFLTVKDMSCEEFCRKIIFEKLHGTAVFCGENYRFGKEGSGGTAELIIELKKYNIKTFVMPFKKLKNDVVSSTKIREMLLSGSYSTAVELLGYNYTFSGKVLHGRKLGRRLGFPTLNIEIKNDTAPVALGVYCTISMLGGKRYFGLSNIGTKPTVTNDHRVFCETYLFDFHDDAYDKTISVELIEFLRPEKKFTDINSLTKQVKSDVTSAIEFFKTYTTETNNAN